MSIPENKIVDSYLVVLYYVFMVNGLMGAKSCTIVRMTQKRKRGRPAGNAKGRSRETGNTVAFTLELALPLKGAMSELSKRDRRTLRAIMEIALEEYLTRQGLWPPGEKE